MLWDMVAVRSRRMGMRMRTVGHDGCRALDGQVGVLGMEGGRPAERWAVARVR